MARILQSVLDPASRCEAQRCGFRFPTEANKFSSSTPQSEAIANLYLQMEMAG